MILCIMTSSVDVHTVPVKPLHFLENQTLETICNDIFQSVENVVPSASTVHHICSKLKMYRMVACHDDIHMGKHVRWLRKKDSDKPLLHPGGIEVNIRCTDQEVYVMILNKYANRVMQYKFDENITFQKLTDEEMIVLLQY